MNAYTASDHTLYYLTITPENNVRQKTGRVRNNAISQTLHKNSKKKGKKRRRVIEKFINLMQYLHTANNINSPHNSIFSCSI